MDVQKSNKICILDVEIDGVKNLKKTDLNPRFVFIKPPNMEILVSFITKNWKKILFTDFSI